MRNSRPSLSKATVSRVSKPLVVWSLSKLGMEKREFMSREVQWFFALALKRDLEGDLEGGKSWRFARLSGLFTDNDFRL
jgi:hypothetical protein